MKLIDSKFIKSFSDPRLVGEMMFQEIAFVGRSNVGKSSLINGLLHRKKLAKTSSTPGKTQLINYFQVTYKQEERTEQGFFHFVDLPGYGYAKVSKTQRNAWRKLIEGYFHQSLFLRGTILLVDIRHEPQTSDLLMAEWLQELGKDALVVATKADKLSNNQIQKSLAKMRKIYHSFPVNDIVACSSLNGTGFSQIIDWMERKIAPCSNK